MAYAGTTQKIDFLQQRVGAFGELKVGSPLLMADIQNRYEVDPRHWGTRTANGGTIGHTAAKAAATLTVTGTASSEATLRTHTCWRYQTGHGNVCKVTTADMSDVGQTNQKRLILLGDDNNGIGFQLYETTLAVIRRSDTSGSVVDTVTPQASWNRDKLNGTGASGMTIDVRLGHIWEIRYQWLGVGDVWFYIDGVLVHYMQHANVIAGPYMRSANLPVTVSIANTGGASSAANMSVVCVSVESEGAEKPTGYGFGIYNPTAISVATGGGRPVLSLRPKATYNAIVNRMLIIIIPKILTAACEANRVGVWLVFGGTLTGPNWVSVGSNSGAEYDVTANALTGGETLVRHFLPLTNDGDAWDISGLFDFHGRKLRNLAFTGSDVLTVMAENEAAAGSSNVRSRLVWDEVR